MRLERLPQIRKDLKLKNTEEFIQMPSIEGIKLKLSNSKSRAQYSWIINILLVTNLNPKNKVYKMSFLLFTFYIFIIICLLYREIHCEIFILQCTKVRLIPTMVLPHLPTSYVKWLQQVLMFYLHIHIQRTSTILTFFIFALSFTCPFPLYSPPNWICLIFLSFNT
jgi:hypothetical protein